MLRYNISRNQFGDDEELVQFSGISVDNYGYSTNNALCVNFACDKPHNLKPGDYVKILSSVEYWNDIMDKPMVDGDVSYMKVSAVDEYANTFIVIASKYKTLSCDSAYIRYENGVPFWYLVFNPTHHYKKTDEYVKLYILYNESDYLYIDNFEVVDCETIRWKYDEAFKNAEQCKHALFGDSDEGTPGMVRITRPQFKWDNYISNHEGIYVYTNRYKVNIDVPIIVDTDIRLNTNENIREYFVDTETNRAVNPVNEMEKRLYTPVIRNGDNFKDVVRINFNLHLREHSGEDWTVENDDEWNFSKYGSRTYGGYYSYNTNESNQSDLLSYLGFTNDDVKYQKNKLKKTFLRLSYYDSMNPGSQNLIAYSTVFFNTGELYTKYIANSGTDIYIDSNGDVVSGVRVDREVDYNNLIHMLGVTTADNDTVERYRISSQMSVRSKYASNNSSEGFYLYLWADSDNGVVPDSIYMKVELNHAGYGRTIPFMAPFWDYTTDNRRGFKQNSEIINDWHGDGYGIQKYIKYSYIKFNYMYDKSRNRHVYYPDPERYGDFSGNVLDINLYEARVRY